MNELEIVKEKGVVTSMEVMEILRKSRQAVWRVLKGLEKMGELKIIDLRGQGNKRLYIENETYKNIFCNKR